MVTQTYSDICKEIQLLELRLKDLKKEYRFYLGFISSHPGQMKTSSLQSDKIQSSNPYMPAEEAYRKCMEINELIVQYDELITNKLSTKREIEKGMSDFETLEGKINYYFHVKNMKLYEIADELGYSYNWIRQVKHRHDNEQRTNKFLNRV